MNSIVVFAAPGAEHLLKGIGEKSGFHIGTVTFSQHPDSELRCEVGESVAGHDVFVIGTTTQALEMAMLIDAVRRSSASRVTALVTYAQYSRVFVRKEDSPETHDRREANNFSIAFAPVLAARPNQLVFLEFPRPDVFTFLEKVDYRNVYSSTYVVPQLKTLWKGRHHKVVSLYPSGQKRARRYAELLGGEYLASVRDVGPGDALFITDSFLTSLEDLELLISTAQEAVDRGATSVSAFFSHTILPKEASAKLEGSVLETLVVSDHLKVNITGSNIWVVHSAPMMAEVIRRTHQGESLASQVLMNHLNHHYP